MEAPTKVRKRDEKRNPTDNLEKDELELRLEKALFGDDAGFLNSLAGEKRQQAEEALVRAYDDGDHEDERLEDQQDDLSDVADEDVSTPIWTLLLPVVLCSDCCASSFSSTQELASFQYRFPGIWNTPSLRTLLPMYSRHGTIATTIASQSHWHQTLDYANYATPRVTTLSAEGNISSASAGSMKAFIPHQTG